MSLELLFALVALTPLAVGAGLLGLGDGEDEPEETDAPDIEELEITTEGGPLADVLLGTSENDVVDALSGDDTVETDEGDDVVFGREGDDDIFGGDDNDTLLGEDGDDGLFGEDGDDALFGGAGADTLAGGAGDDILYGADETSDDDEADEADGGDGDDFLELGAGDQGTGGAGADVFSVGGTAAITDFNAEDDQIIVRYDAEPAPEIESQTVTATGVTVTLSDGTVISLDGLTEAIPEDRIAFVGPSTL